MTDLYAERSTRALGKRYLDHMMAMTAECLFSKSEIAAELAFRDARIAELEAKTQWQLIEIAPTDGTEILVYWYYTYPGDQEATYLQGFMCWDEHRSIWNKDPENTQREVFTHWMPKPANP